MSDTKIVIAGGGTGGHIYPALAIAEAIRKRDPQIQIHFVGTNQGLETKIIPKSGWPLHTIDVGKLNYSGSWLKKIWTLLKLPWSFVQSAALLFDLKPQAVLGVGGYASGPFVLISTVLGFRTSLWEPNAIPGFTNRILSLFVRRSYVVFDEARKFLRSKHLESVGLPIREALESIPEKSKPNEDGFFHILVFGGSQGALTINRIVSEAVLSGEDWRRKIKITHQTGVADFASISKKYEGLNHVKALEYLHDMENQYAWADLVICRAGASTVAELAACGKPAIFIPLPSAADDHQVKNASALVQKDAAEMILQKNLNAQVLIQKITELISDSNRLKTIAKNVKQFHRPRAAEKMADLLLNQIGE